MGKKKIKKGKLATTKQVVTGSFLDIMKASVKDAKAKSAPKKP
jgi:hypothetical protein